MSLSRRRYALVGSGFEILGESRGPRRPRGILGLTILGGFDISRLQALLNQVKVATVAQLGGMVDKAITIEQFAIVAATSAKLPGDTTRQALLQRLVAHRADLSAVPNQQHPVLDPGLSAVKADVIAAAVDLNSVEEGAQYQTDHAFDLFNDLTLSAASLLSKAGHAVEEVTWWVKYMPWLIGGAAVVAAAVVIGPIVVPVIVAKIQGRR